MYKIGVCGHFGEDKNLLNGQTIKTKILMEELKKELGEHAVVAVDTYNWRRHPILLIMKCFNLIKDCDDVVILPAHNGVKVFVPMFLFFNKLFNKGLHYVVIGGWLPELLASNKKLKYKVSKFNSIYVETHSMINILEAQGLKNIKYLPNFKRLNVLNENELIYPNNKPYKLCTFSRVSKEKGIEDAIEAVKYVNRTIGYEAYTLDIYGQVDEHYRDRFDELKKSFPKYISYKGVVDYNNTVNVLKEYFALLFPTYYEGEGFAGTILDAFAAGIPVFATNWRYNPEIIQDECEGLLYDYNNPEGLQEILLKSFYNPNEINKMKLNSLKRAKEYLPETAIIMLFDYINKKNETLSKHSLKKRN